MQLTSSAFSHFGSLPNKYTCQGEGINPPITINNVSKDAKSLVLIIDDPDAPTGTFTHWIVWNIPPTTKDILEGEVPAGAIEGENSLGEIGYTPPCPPNGMHNYHFIVSALSQVLSLGQEATKDELEREIAQYVLERAEIVGKYEKNGESSNSPIMV